MEDLRRWRDLGAAHRFPRRPRHRHHRDGSAQPGPALPGVRRSFRHAASRAHGQLGRRRVLRQSGQRGRDLRRQSFHRDERARHQGRSRKQRARARRNRRWALLLGRRERSRPAAASRAERRRNGRADQPHRGVVDRQPRRRPLARDRPRQLPGKGALADGACGKPLELERQRADVDDHHLRAARCRHPRSRAHDDRGGGEHHRRSGEHAGLHRRRQLDRQRAEGRLPIRGRRQDLREPEREQPRPADQPELAAARPEPDAPAVLVQSGHRRRSDEPEHRLHRRQPRARALD